jgi:hypothetical protein
VTAGSARPGISALCSSARAIASASASSEPDPPGRRRPSRSPDPRRHVITYDPNPTATRDRYLRLVPDDVGRRIELRREHGEQPPPTGTTADFVFVDSWHELDTTTESFRVWEPLVEPDGVVVFHDYGNPAWPGVAAAIEALKLQGEVEPFLFVWRKPATRD